LNIRHGLILLGCPSRAADQPVVCDLLWTFGYLPCA
jgi:hypothetical protein